METSELIEAAMFKWNTEHLPGEGMTGADLVALVAEMIVAAVDDHERRHHAGEARTEGDAR